MFKVIWFTIMKVRFKTGMDHPDTNYGNVFQVNFSELYKIYFSYFGELSLKNVLCVHLFISFHHVNNFEERPSKAEIEIGNSKTS